MRRSMVYELHGKIEDDNDEDLVRLDREKIVVTCDSIVKMLEAKLEEVQRSKECMKEYINNKMEMQAREFIQLTVLAL
jgi:uncharacterized protein YPO0396